MNNANNSAQFPEQTKYVTAKIVLLGDPGVGKTELGRKLAQESHLESTKQGQNFWVVNDFSTTLNDETKCEAILWDLIGRPIYQYVHPILLDDVDVALILFDPTNRQNILTGVEFWLKQLSYKQDLPPCILVGTRIDRGGLAIPENEVLSFCEKHKISGGYIETSSLTGEGIDKLRGIINFQISWTKVKDKTTITAFNMIKNAALRIREQDIDNYEVLHLDEFRNIIETTNEGVKLTPKDILESVKHLRKHGYIDIFLSSFGDTFILLKPELLVDISSSIVNLAANHPRGLGALSEAQLLRGELNFPELANIDKERQNFIVEDVVTRLIEHNICFREKYGADDLLIFPSLIKQKRPSIVGNVNDDVSYIVQGNVKDIYPALVVLLGFTKALKRFNQWQNQVQFEYEEKEEQICGFRLLEERDDEIEMALYYGDKMPLIGRKSFQDLYEFFLCQRAVTVLRFPHVVCNNCKNHQEQTTIINRLKQGKNFAFCNECGVQLEIPRVDELEKPKMIGTENSSWLQLEKSVVQLRHAYETHLVSVKSYLGLEITPRCYLSFLPDDEKWASKLANDLGKAGIEIINKISEVSKSDYVITLDTPAYQSAWEKSVSLLEADTKLIKSRISHNDRKLITITQSNKTENNSAHKINQCYIGNFSDETHYPISLFDLVLSIYAIPLNNPNFFQRRMDLHQQWEKSVTAFSLQRKKENVMNTPLKVFISYSHKDEEFKDELVTMLASMQRHGIIEAWQDRRIEEGDEWYQEIQDAMNDSDLAILLVSANFLASRFIQDEELPKLFKRRIEGGMRVVPIIVKQCMWQSEPVIKDIQVMPRDGKPVITFSKDNGDRDQVWTDIAKAIEKRAK